MIKIAVMNLYLHGLENANVRHHDPLTLPTENDRKYDLNLTAGRYKPHLHEVSEYAEPGAVIAEVLQLEERISSGLKGLLEKI